MTNENEKEKESDGFELEFSKYNESWKAEALAIWQASRKHALANLRLPNFEEFQAAYNANLGRVCHSLSLHDWLFDEIDRLNGMGEMSCLEQYGKMPVTIKKEGK